MNIKKYSCKRFGGLKDTDIEFREGLNVILGPNEAGKSTIVNGIYSTIFKESKIRRGKKEFYEKFKPHPNGDFFNGSIHVEINGDSYSINKEWGENTQSIMELFDGSIIKDENSIKERLSKLLKLGEGAYKNIVFARQSDIKSAIQRILDDSDATQNISSILRKGVMELDGLSIEKLRAKIEERLDSLLKYWDYDNSRPQNNRDIHNPYKKGVGEILEAYYKKRIIERDMEEAERIEREFEEISKNIKTLEKEITDKSGEINRLTKLEGDVLKRAQLIPKIDALNANLGNLKDLNKKWPVEETNLKNYRTQLEKLNQSMEALDKEYEKAKKIKELKVFENIINKVDTKKSELKSYLDKKKSLPNIGEKDIIELDKMKNTMERNKTAIEAGTLITKLNNRQNREIWITKGLEKRQKINSHLEFKANGFLKLEIEDDIEIEIKSGEIDFDSLSQEYNDLEIKFQNKLQDIGVEDVDKARSIVKELKEIDNKTDMLQIQISDLLGEYKYDDIKSKALQVKGTDNARDIEEITKEKTICNTEIIKFQADIKHTERQIDEWQNKYESHDKLTDSMVEIMTEIKMLEKELDDLQPLPKEFNSPDEFQVHLSNLRIGLDNLKSQLSDNKEKFYKLESNLPDISYEELKDEYDYAQVTFNNLLKNTDNLLKIREKFLENLELMGQNSFKSLEASFNKYLSKLTKGKYSIDNMDGNLDIKLKTANNAHMPITLLSTGTYDSISLAFRFAVLENIYDKNGLVVLDDCLVDLDPKRKQEAVEIIKEFAKNNQVIFTTCDPNTASLLKGHVIEIQ